MTIDHFRKDYFFLSSMYPTEQGVATPDGVVVASVEIGYQADKFEDEVVREKILSAENGFAAKNLAKQLEEEGIPIRPDWEESKIDVMRWYVFQKFIRNPDIAEKLIATGDEELVEGNNWGDRFWGVSPRRNGKGENHLGRLLMEMRTFLKEERSLTSLDD